MSPDASTGQPLFGRSALVTGAGAGLGAAIALALAKAGAQVVCADEDGDAASTTAERINERAGAATSCTAAAESESSIASAVATTLERHGGLDVMCNAVLGAGDGAVVVDITEESFDRIFGMNFKSAFLGCQAAGRVMSQQGSGSIINVCSAVIDRPEAAAASYSVASTSVSMLTKVMAKEIGPRNVRVNSIACRPHPELSPLPEGPGLQNYIARVDQQTVLDRKASLEDVAATACFLASDSSAFVTGQTLRVTGGWTMPW